MNWESAGYLSLKDTEVESPSKGWSTIVRASISFGSGEFPEGKMRARYGGVPPLPVIDIERLEHCWGGELMLNEKAETSGIHAATALDVASAYIGENRRLGIAGDNIIKRRRWWWTRGKEVTG